MSHAPRILPAPASHYETALRLLLADIPADERPRHVAGLLEYVAQGRGSLDLLLVAEPVAHPAGVILTMMQPGKLAILWPPRLHPTAPPDLAENLIQTALAAIRETDCVLVQAQLEPYSADKQLLLSAGFQQVGDLLFMCADAAMFPPQRPQSELTFEPYQPAVSERLCRIIEASYEKTLDCPSLNGVRQMTDVLDGYAEVGEHHPSDWFIVTSGEADVGCLLLARHPQSRQMELIYMGILPRYRGKAYGAQLVRHALWHAGQMGQQMLSLAVDAGNTPALRMYSACGLVTWQRRWTFLKLLQEAG